MNQAMANRYCGTSNGVSTTPAPPSGPGPLLDSCGRLVNAMSELRSSVTELEMRLAPILLSTGPEGEGGDTNMKDAEKAPLTSEIDERINEISGMLRQLSSIKRRLAL